MQSYFLNQREVISISWGGFFTWMCFCVFPPTMHWQQWCILFSFSFSRLYVFLVFTQDCTCGCITPRLKQTSCSYIPFIIHLLKDLLLCCNICFYTKGCLQYKTLLNIASNTVHFFKPFFFFMDHHLTFPRMLSKNCGSCFTRTLVLGVRSHLFHKLKVQIFSSIWLVGLARSNHFSPLPRMLYGWVHTSKYFAHIYPSTIREISVLHLPPKSPPSIQISPSGGY